MKSPTIWVSFLRVPKSPERGNDEYAGFFGGDGSPCNIGIRAYFMAYGVTEPISMNAFVEGALVA
jgi:hypothetical protein